MSIKKNTKAAVFAWLTAVALLFNSICLLANDLVPFVDDFGKLLIIAMMLMLFVFAMPRVEINRTIFFYNIAILFLIGLSYLIYDLNSEILSLMINYFCWGVGVSIMLMQVHSPAKVMDMALVMASVIVAVNLLTDQTSGYYGAMVWTYAIFPCIAVIATHFVFLRKKGWMMLFYIPLVFVLLRYVDLANRGGIVSMAFLFYFLTVRRVTKANTLKNRVLLNILLMIVIIVTISLYDKIILWLYDTMEALNLDIYAIKRMHIGLIADNILNNRGELYRSAWEGFSNSPLFGNGIGAFAVHHGGWIHNFVLQLLYEGGAVLFLGVMVPFLYIVFFFVTRKDIRPEEYALFVVFFTTSVPKLLFSQELWNVQGFWMMMTFGMLTIKRHKSSRRERLY